MFEQLDSQGRLVLHEAERVAHRLAHHYIGTEHLLVGLAGVEGGSNRVLVTCGLDAADLEQEVAEMLGRGRSPITVRPPLTSAAELVLERARWHARQQGRSGAADEDLLQALLQLADSTAATVLRRLGVDPATIEEQLCRSGSFEPVGEAEPGQVGQSSAAHLREKVPVAGPPIRSPFRPEPVSHSREALVQDLIELRQEVRHLRAEVARLSSLVERR